MLDFIRRYCSYAITICFVSLLSNGRSGQPFHELSRIDRGSFELPCFYEASSYALGEEVVRSYLQKNTRSEKQRLRMTTNR